MSDPIITVRGLVMRFGAITAVDGIDFDVARGECVGILGPNGAGKTTTLELLEGLRAPTAGTLELLGATWKTPDAIRPKIGIQLQETTFLNMLTVEETLYFFRSFYPDAPDPEPMFAELRLEEKRGALYQTLSGGQKQRVSLAVAMLANPEIVFLDEPTTGLDPQARRALWDVISNLKRRGKTILLTTHYMEEAEFLCDRILVIDRGKIVAQGTSEEIIARLDGTDLIELTCEPAAAAARVATLEGVVHTEAGPNGVTRVLVNKLHLVLPRLLERLSGEGAVVTRLSTRRISLDDAFLKITGHHLREGDATADLG